MDKVDSSLLVRALSDGRDSVPRGTPATALPKLLYPIINDALGEAFQPMQRISIQAYPGFLNGLDLAHAETTNYKALAPLVTTAISTWRDVAQRLQNVDLALLKFYEDVVVWNRMIHLGFLPTPAEESLLDTHSLDPNAVNHDCFLPVWAPGLPCSITPSWLRAV